MLTVQERIKQFNSPRIPEYTAIKYKLMTEDPFTFFRGTCHLFYEDLHRFNQLPASPAGWVCGDLHLENFGSYKGDNRLVYFDLTDFDEGILAPVSWELVRMTSSILIALDEPKSQKLAAAAAQLYLGSYATELSAGKARYIQQQTATGVVRTFLDKVAERKQKDLVDKRTFIDKGKRRLRIDKVKLFDIDPALKKELILQFMQWLQENASLHHAYEVSDLAFRVAGTGSIGLARYLFLLKKGTDEKYLLVDMKQARSSALQPYTSTAQPAWISEADRIIAIQQRMQNMLPALLSTAVFRQQPFIVKEMQPTEDKIQFDLVRHSEQDLSNLMTEMALLTASAQLRSSGRQGSATADELIAFDAQMDWQKPLLDYALAYTKQVKKDHAAYVHAYDTGFFKR